MLKILLVEDDHVQRSYVQQALAESLGATVETKTCESEFVRDFESIASDPPDVAVLDIMLRWASPSRHGATPPADSTPYHAGLRCAQKLSGDPRTCSVKVILYSVLPKEDIPDFSLPEIAVFVVKESDCQNLIDVVRDACAAPTAGN
ncbi:MAG: response regulator [Bryobacteraceae bacterium]|jgi:CheY-like chemotaxis protein